MFDVRTRTRENSYTLEGLAGLGITEKTVKAHLTRVFAALDVSDRTQAALWVAHHTP